jgi:hypothetical protein
VRALAILIAAFLCGAARGASFDPALTWRTLDTPHFRVTFHGGEEQLAEEASLVLESVWAEMTTELDHEPRRKVEVVLVDNTDSANGYAMTVPINTIVIYVTAPEDGSSLSLYERWDDAILTHEFSHILHLDTTEGFVRAVRAVLGRIISTNNISPGWIIEGQATFQETRNTNAGRGRAPITDMLKRVATLEDDFPPLGNLDGYQSDPPGGNLRYIFGQDFMQFISDRTGTNVWTDWNHVYGGWIPYWLPSHRVFGKSFVRLYREWRAELVTRYARQRAAVEAQGLTTFELLTDDEDQCAAPSFSPDGHHLVWSCSDPRKGSAIWSMALEPGQSVADGEPEIEIEKFFASHVAWRPDSRAFAYSTSHIVSRFNLYNDVYLFTLGGDGTKALTTGKRARDPEFSPTGDQLLVVLNETQDNQLARFTIDQRLVPLTDYHDHTQLSTPRFSPDGRFLAMSVWSRGRRDLWLYTPDGRPYRQLTADSALDITPTWSNDGGTLYFASDRSGIFNVYAIDVGTDRLWQVTNVLGGAFQPTVSPDGRELVFESYNHTGQDIAWMALDRSKWWDLGFLPHTWEDQRPLVAALPDPAILEANRWRLAEETKRAKPDDDDKDEKEKRREEKKERRDERKAWRDARGRFADEEPVAGIEGLGSALPFPRIANSLADEPPQGPLSIDPTAGKVDQPDEEAFDFTYPVTRYHPLPSLFPPRYVVPGITRTSYGWLGVLATGGTDVLRRYFYSAYVSYRTDGSYVGWGGAFLLNQFLPTFTVGAYSYITPYGDVYVYPGPPDDGGGWIPSVESDNAIYWDRRTRAYAQASYDLSTYRTIFLRYEGQLRQPDDPLPADAYLPLVPTRGFLSSVGGGWRYAKGTSYAKSISPEDAEVVSLVAEYTSPYLGSYVLDDQNQAQPFEQIQLTGEVREYRTAPWIPNHVIAGKLAVGAAFGDSLRYGSYRLGGSFGESSAYTLPDEWRALRGFPVATVDGDWYYLGTLEYRFPIAYIDRGVGTIPFFARYLSAAAFIDAGNAFYDLDDAGFGAILSETLVGAGAELRGTAVLGWGWGLTVRAGYAFAVLGDGYAIGSPDGFYVWLGSSF